MTEPELLAMIDARFPYGDEAAWKALIDEARTFPANVMYAVLEEIASPPRNARVSREMQRRMVEYWRAGFDHPLAEIVTACALARIAERPIEIPLALSIMRRVAGYPGEYAALNIVAATANDETVPLVAFDAIDDLDLEIRTRWHTIRCACR